MLGAVAGAPVLGTELERGTWQLAWRRPCPGAGGWPPSWGWSSTAWSSSPPAQRHHGLGLGAAVPGHIRSSRPRSTSRALAACALLCAFGLALLAGLLLRNTIAAMVIAYIGWEIPTTVVALMSGPILIPAPAVMRIGCPAGCPGAGTGTVPPVTGHLGDFVLGVTRSGGQLVVSYLPASRFWTEQLIQGGLYLAVVAIALGAAMWLLHRRTT